MFRGFKMMVEESPLSGASEEGTISWWEAWSTALLKPNQAAYESLAHNPSITTKKVLLWVLIGSLLWGVGLLANRLIYSPQDLPSLSVMLCGIPIFSPLLGLVAFLIIVGVTHGIAKIFGGDGYFEELIRPVGSFTAPLMIIMIVITLIPVVRYANYGLSVYQIGLAILSVKAVHRFGCGKAMVSCITYILPTIFDISNAW